MENQENLRDGFSDNEIFQVVESELTTEERKYIIDVSRHDFKSDDDFFAEFGKLERRVSSTGEYQ